MKAKIIILETTNKSASYPAIIKQYSSGKLISGLTSQKDKICHFYLIDESAEIKEGDWYIDLSKKTSNYGLHKCDSERIASLSNQFKGKFAKIIASTDKLALGSYQGHFEDIDCTNYLPQLSEQSIQLLIDYYNKNGKMPDEVEVNFEYKNKPMSDLFIERKIKLNSEGTVDITIPEEKKYSK